MQKIHPCSLEDIDPTVPNSHIICFQTLILYSIPTSHVCSYLHDLDHIVCSKTSKSYFLADPVFKILKNSTDGSSGLFGHRHFNHLRNIRVRTVRFPTLILWKTVGFFLELFEVTWWSQSFGTHGHVHEVRKPWIRNFPRWILKVNNPKWNRMTKRSFWATLSEQNTIQLAPQSPQTPKPDFSKPSQMFYRILLFFVRPICLWPTWYQLQKLRFTIKSLALLFVFF